MISYQKYKGIILKKEGKTKALQIIRKHRLWEVFFGRKTQLKWDEVHEVAEQLEHICSPLLIQRLNDFLEKPTVDPHRDSIPDEEGNINEKVLASVFCVSFGSVGILSTVSNDDSSLLKQLYKIDIRLGTKLQILDWMKFDESTLVKINDKEERYLSKLVADVFIITLLE